MLANHQHLHYDSVAGTLSPRGLGEGRLGWTRVCSNNFGSFCDFFGSCWDFPLAFDDFCGEPVGQQPSPCLQIFAAQRLGWELYSLARAKVVPHFQVKPPAVVLERSFTTRNLFLFFDFKRSLLQQSDTVRLMKGPFPKELVPWLAGFFQFPTSPTLPFTVLLLLEEVAHGGPFDPSQKLQRMVNEERSQKLPKTPWSLGGKKSFSNPYGLDGHKTKSKRSFSGFPQSLPAPFYHLQAVQSWAKEPYLGHKSRGLCTLLFSKTRDPFDSWHSLAFGEFGSQSPSPVTAHFCTLASKPASSDFYSLKIFLGRNGWLWFARQLCASQVPLEPKTGSERC